MHERPKVFVIVFRRNHQKLEYLALNPNPEPGRNTDPYVVTGGVEEGETVKAAALREVEEEIGMQPVVAIDLQNELRYQDQSTGERYVEYCYGVLVAGDVKKLNEEHIGYQWLEAEQFINAIWWDDDTNGLRKMIATIEAYAAEHR